MGSVPAVPHRPVEAAEGRLIRPLGHNDQPIRLSPDAGFQKKSGVSTVPGMTTPDEDRNEQRPSRAPFSRPPAAPKSWWGTVPGQLALVAMLGGAIVIALGLMGIIGPLSLR